MTAFETQICPQAPFVLLEDSLNAKRAVLLFDQPHQIIEAQNIEQVQPAFEQIEQALDQGHHVAGFMNYELGLALEPKLHHLLPKDTPLLWFGVFKNKTLTTHQYLKDWLDQNNLSSKTTDLENISIHPQEKFTSYEEKFKTVKNAIKEGSIYQLNLTFKADITGVDNVLALYEEMRLNQPVSYASLIMTGQQTILSASPELFVKSKDSWLETRPMKGTLKRAPSRQEDLILQKSLKEDEKSQAENLMIVDLMCNDLSRIAKTGSVSVEDLFKVETYHSLHQMISIVRAEQKPGLSLYEQMQALFPPGSITGAPKIKAMELIDQLETSPRGVYTGAIGYFAPGGDYCFNVAIRTVNLDNNGNGEVGIGAGLVYDSKAREEYDECLLKMQFLQTKRPQFSLLETMAYKKNEGILFKREHSDRLEHSANYFQIPFDRQEFEALLDSFTQNTKCDLRLRVVLSQSGTLSITPGKLDEVQSDEVWTVAWAQKPMHTKNIFLYHKTTHRDFYDMPRARMQAKDQSIKEVLFLNERGEVTEGSFTNIFIEDDKGKLQTPPLSAGLLPGTLRQNLLDTGKAYEQSLTLEDVSAAQSLYVGNSVRGLIKAKLI